ncbi:MAG: hypothetical protein KME26_26455 [Oscillatoria princeps RMCB-10]|nr:hypothetical protein [Oscillatoria princeps RMCB-10]
MKIRYFIGASSRLKNRIRYLILMGLILLVGISVNKVASQSVPRRPDFFPLGVYWIGTYTFNDSPSSERWRQIDKALDDLAQHHVNAIWLTKLPAAEGAEFARRAAQRNIYLVASLEELQGHRQNIRRGNHPRLIANTLRTWSNAPPPIAWGLGDEPKTEYMNEMAAFVRAWKTRAPGEPVTAVVSARDVFSAGKAGFDILCGNMYPFYGNGYSLGAEVPPWAAWLMVTRNTVSQNPLPWMMAQGFQYPEGPYELDERNHIVYLPGSARFWVMPTPAQIKWQAWSAIATGSKGLFYFTYRWPIESNPQAPPTRYPVVVRERTNSNAPKALVYDDLRPTPQYEAVGETFGKLEKLTPVLAPLKPVPGPEAWVTNPVGNGTIANVLLHPQTKKRYLILVASYDSKEEQTIEIAMGPHIKGLKSLINGNVVEVDVAAPFRKATVILPPGEGEVFECEVDEDNLPDVYSDDFTSDKFIKDSVNGTANGVERFVSIYGNWLSATDRNQKGSQAFLTYDIDRLFGAMPPGGIRMLLYSGYSNTPRERGAFWSGSKDGQQYTALSSNQFDIGIPFWGRYLKVQLSQIPSGLGAPRQGYLRRITFSQWKRPVEADGSIE